MEHIIGLNYTLKAKDVPFKANAKDFCVVQHLSFYRGKLRDTN